jgi:hypothetical protein
LKAGRAITVCCTAKIAISRTFTSSAVAKGAVGAASIAFGTPTPASEAPR